MGLPARGRKNAPRKPDYRLLDASGQLPALIDSAMFPESWNIDENRMKSLVKVAKGSYLKHGLCAEIPIVCKAEGCLYRETCEILSTGMAIPGERCIKEIGYIAALQQRYEKDLGIDPQDPNQIIDATSLAELIACEVTINRCDRILAVKPMIQDIVTAVGPKGELILNPEEHRALTIRDKVVKQKHDIMRLLNATRKDKARMAELGKSPAETISDLLEANEVEGSSPTTYAVDTEDEEDYDDDE